MPFVSREGKLLLRVAVFQSVSSTIVAPSYVRLESEWASNNTCYEFLLKILREHQHDALASRLPECVIVFRCVSNVGVPNALGSKRSKAVDEVICTTFLYDNLAETLDFIDSNDLVFHLTLPLPPERPAQLVDARDRLMRASASTSMRPPRKNHQRMTGEHNLYNAILDYLAAEGVGWSSFNLPSGKEFLDHVSKAFWVLTPKVRDPVTSCVRLFNTRDGTYISTLTHCVG